MSILTACDNCGKQFNVRDKDAGRKGKCPKCGETVVVPMPAPASVDANPPSLPADAPRKKTVVSKPAVDTFRVMGEDGSEYGPADQAQLELWHQQGRISPGCRILRVGDSRWQPADVFFDFPETAPTPTPVPKPKPTPQPQVPLPSTPIAAPAPQPIMPASAEVPTANPYAAPAATYSAAHTTHVHVTHENETDAAGVISLILGIVGMIFILFGCLFSCIGGFIIYPVAAFMCLFGLIIGFFGKGNLRVAGIVLNFLVLIPAAVMCAIVFGLLTGATLSN